jgi:hypothetical protein
MQHDIKRDRRHPRPEIRSAAVYDGMARLGTVKVERDRFTAVTDTGRVIGERRSYAVVAIRVSREPIPIFWSSNRLRPD